MSVAAHIAARMLRTCAVAVLLTLPTIVGALSAPADEQGTGACVEDEIRRLEPSPEPISACLEFLPDETGPEDDHELPPERDPRTASVDRRTETM